MQYLPNVAYPNPGFRPKIPKGTLITIKTRSGIIHGPKSVDLWQWNVVNTRGDILEFTIVDPSFPVAPGFELPWFEKGEYPPIGTLCEFSWARKVNWYPCVLLPDGYIASKKLPYAEWVVNKIVEFGDLEFRPIKSEKEKVIQAAASEFHKKCMADYSGQPFIDGLTALYDAGMLQMPTKEPK